MLYMISGTTGGPANHQSPAASTKPAPSSATVSAARTYTGEAVTGALATPSDGNKAVLAIAAELRLVYQAEVSNTQATQAAAEAISTRYGGGNQVKQWTSTALQMVLHETPAERATNSDLAKVDQAGANLNQLEAQNGTGQASSAAVKSAYATYSAAQLQLMKDVESELTAARAKIPPSTCYVGSPAQRAAEQEPAAEPRAEAAVLADHVSDPELTTALDAAVICQNVTSAPGGIAQIKALGTQLSSQGPLATQLAGSGMSTPDIAATLSDVQSLVLSDPGVQKVIKQYVSHAAQQVAATQNTSGSEWAANELEQIVVQQLAPAIPDNTELLSQIASQVINSCMPTIKQMIGASGSLTLTTPLNAPPGLSTPMQSGIVLASDLSRVVDVAAAAGTSSTGQYDSPEITAAVNGVAQAIATHPQAGMQVGLRDAVSQGYATLALATALATRQLTPAEMAAGSGVPTSSQAFAAWQNSTFNQMMANIKSGIGELQNNVKQTYVALGNSTPQLTAQSIYASDLTPSQYSAGVSAMVNGLPASKDGPKVAPVPGLKAALTTGFDNIAAIGQRVAATDNAVTFYSNTALGKTSAYSGVQGASDTLIQDPNAGAAMMASPGARALITQQAARASTSQSANAQLFSTGAQTLGDFDEFIVESYANDKNPTAANLVLQGGEGPSTILDAARIGHTPFAAAWAAGGGFQGMLTDWMVHNSHPGGPASIYRKSLSLLIVGGFGTLHSYQAIAAVTRWLGANGVFGSGIGANGSVVPGTKLDGATRLTVEPTLGLMGTLQGLMDLATVSDAAGLAYSAFGWQPWSTTTQQVVNASSSGANLVADIALARLQFRGVAANLLGKSVLSSSGDAIQQGYADAMLDAMGQPQLVPVGTDVDPVLLAAAKQQLLNLQKAGGPNAPATKVLELEKLIGGRSLNPQTGDSLSQTALDFLNKNGLTFNNLSKTSQRSVAGDWASQGEATLSAEGVTADGNVADILESLGGGQGAGASSAAAEQEATEAVTEEVAGEATEEVSEEATTTITTALATGAAADTVPVLGWIVNGVYLATTLTTTFFNQYEKSKQSQQDQYAFLRGAGFDGPHAAAMSAHSFLSDTSASAGLAAAYSDLGGNPNEFVSYINKMPISKLDSVLSGLAATPTTALPATAKQDYWTLPANPFDAEQRRFNPNLTYDSSARTWKDDALNVTFKNGVWMQNGSTALHQKFYDPATQKFVTETAGARGGVTRSTPVAPLSVAGLKTWLAANGVPLPPTGGTSSTPSTPSAPATPEPPSATNPPLVVSTEPANESPLPTSSTVRPWSSKNQSSSTAWGIATANVGTLLSESQDEVAAKDHWSTSVKDGLAYEELVALNPGNGLSPDPEDANIVYPAETLNVVNPEAP